MLNSVIPHDPQNPSVRSATLEYSGYASNESQNKENLAITLSNNRKDPGIETDSAASNHLGEIENRYPVVPNHNEFGTHRASTLDASESPEIESKVSQKFVADLDRNKKYGVANREGEVEDDEDSDKEQISSALYYPHEAPCPDLLEELNTGSTSQPGDSKNTEPFARGSQLLDRHDNETQSEDVDIALQSRNSSRYLHGDLPKSWVSSVEPAEATGESEASSASDTDYDSLDENVLSEVGEESSHTDELEVTPTATPTVKDSFLAPRKRKIPHLGTTPLGAVELKPYNHQVGGHTKVFQFSRRAVCKQLSNRENVFYEVIEREHPELLKFLPRYDI